MKDLQRTTQFSIPHVKVRSVFGDMHFILFHSIEILFHFFTKYLTQVWLKKKHYKTRLQHREHFQTTNIFSCKSRLIVDSVDQTIWRWYAYIIDYHRMRAGWVYKIHILGNDCVLKEQVLLLLYLVFSSCFSSQLLSCPFARVHICRFNSCSKHPIFYSSRTHVHLSLPREKIVHN